MVDVLLDGPAEAEEIGLIRFVVGLDGCLLGSTNARSEAGRRGRTSRHVRVGKNGRALVGFRRDGRDLEVLPIGELDRLVGKGIRLEQRRFRMFVVHALAKSGKSLHIVAAVDELCRAMTRVPFQPRMRAHLLVLYADRKAATVAVRR